MNIREQAAWCGFTVEVAIETDFQSLSGFVQPGADYEGVFPMVCGDTGERLAVRGWTCSVEEVAPAAPTAQRQPG
jgi:hypothetical protein